MKKIILNDLILRIVKSTGYDKSIVKDILGHIVPEIKYEVIQGNKFILPGILSIYRRKISDAKINNNIAKIVNEYSVRAKVSQYLVASVNFGKRKDQN